MFQHVQYVYFIPLMLVVLTVLYINSRRKRRKRVTQLTKLKPENSPHKNHCVIRSRLKVTFTILGFTFLMLALGRPQFGYEWKEQRKKERNILLALDISHSMLVEDLYPNRLERSKLILREIIESEPYARIGLLVFAGNTFLQCPITEDHSALIETLNEQSPELINKQGSDLSKVLMSLPDIVKNPKSDKIILISDGEDHSTRINAAISYLENEKISVNAICIGTTKGGLIPNQSGGSDTEPYFYDEQGNVVFSKANPTHLQNITTRLNGSMIHFESENYSIRKLNKILVSEASDGKKQAKKRRIPVDYYQIPLLISFLFFCIDLAMGTRKPELQTR